MYDSFYPCQGFFLTEVPYGWSERGQGRRFSAFISTLDPVPTTPPESSWEQSSDVFSELCSLSGPVLRNDPSSFFASESLFDGNPRFHQPCIRPGKAP